MTLVELQSLTKRLGMPGFAAKQIASWLYEKKVASIDDMTNLSLKHRELLKQNYEVGAEAPVDEMRSVDGTVKYLYKVGENHFVESVYIPDDDRATLCVSSQVGCKMNCKFCMTGKQGYTANLTASQIMNQIHSLPERDKLTNVVMMGMGEPLDNLDEVLKALELLTATYGYAWSPKRITLSTVGLRKGLQRFIEENDCHLAISLHSPLTVQRAELMPAEKAFSITEMVELLKNYDFSKQRRLSFEYIVFKGLNDSQVYAKELLKLLRGLDCRVNLIRFHAIPGVDLEGADMDTMTRFRDYLTSHGLFTTIRSSRGEDIFAACGMLSTAKQEKNNESEYIKPNIMKKYSFILCIALVAFVVASCGLKGNHTSSGRAYELLVVVDHGVWDRAAGRALHDALDADMPGLPQSEPSFRIMYTSPKDYDSTLKLIRNIIIVDIQDIYTKASFKYAKDVYANPQMILTIQAPNEEEFEKFVEENKKTIVDFFTRAEMNRQITFLEGKHSNFISQKVDSLFGCDIWVDAELANSKTGDDFFWASTNTGTADRNFVMYSYPYTDKDTFTKEYFVHKRDSVMKANIPGFKEGVYMSTDSLLTDVRPINVQNSYTMEARGLWRMKGDFMGGPYVSHTRLDEKNQRIITAEIFVYSPDKMKRNLVRQMEASLYTLKLPNEVQQNQIPLGEASKEAEQTNK